MRRLALAMLLLTACPKGQPLQDAGVPDAGPLTPDAGQDAGSDAGFDAGVDDAGVFDAGPPIAGSCGATTDSDRFGGDDAGAFNVELGSAVAFDFDGNVALTGTYFGRIDFGEGPLSDPGANAGMFVALVDPDGDQLWSRGFADPSRGVILQPHAGGLALAKRGGGDVFVAGAFAGIIDFGKGPLASADPLAFPDSGIAGGCLSGCASDIVVMRLSAGDGTTVWARRFGGNDADQANAIALDSAGVVYVAGSTTGAVDFGDGADASYGGRDIFLLALDGNDGGFLWQQRFGGPADDSANALAVDDAGVVLAGRYQETVDFGGGVVLASIGVPDAFVVRLNAWGASLQASTRAEAASVALDSQGAAWVAGTFRGSTDGGLGVFTSAFDDGFVAKVSSAGTLLYSKRLGGTLNDAAYGVAIGPMDHAFITGNVAVDTVDFGGGPLAGGAGDDFFLLELDASGAHQCSRRYPSQNGGSSGRAIAVDPVGRAYVTGDFFGSVDFGHGPLTATAGTDVFYAVFAQH
jgi:hypothetical protein